MEKCALDESKFEIFGQKRRVFVRRSVSEKMIAYCVLPTVKHGGRSVLVWSCFPFAGMGDLVKIEGIIKKEQYKKILIENVILFGTKLIGRNFIFMQDNDSKHTSRLCSNSRRPTAKKVLTKMI